MNFEQPAVGLAEIHWRLADLVDIPDMVALEAELFPADAWSREIFSQELMLVPGTREYRVGRTATSEAELVAYGGISILGPDSEVMTFAIAPSYQRRGLGTEFLGQLINAARDRGCKQMYLEVRADNTAALQLYRNAGFVEGERRKRYYSDGVDAVLMSKVLVGEEDGGADV